jgi:hypothetical protein
MSCSARGQSLGHRDITVNDPPITGKTQSPTMIDENKVILQEKAVIQGQFKQLQSSL